MLQAAFTRVLSTGLVSPGQMVVNMTVCVWTIQLDSTNVQKSKFMIRTFPSFINAVYLLSAIFYGALCSITYNQ